MTPVCIFDQDMHALANHSAQCGYVTCELNPADSHGIFGEYWQNRGPGTEEKLALTTAGLLTQHFVINPLVCIPYLT
jgi:phage-related tail fiber protein